MKICSALREFSTPSGHTGCLQQT